MRLLCWSLSLFCAVAVADEVSELHTMLAKTTHLQAAFIQQQFDEAGELTEESRGQMALQQPNLVRWFVASPFEQLLLGDGQWIWQYDIELEQVVRRPYPEDASQTPLLVFTESEESLRQNYAIALSEDGCFVLSPRDEQRLFSEMSLCFSGEQLTQFSLLDGFGQRTHVALEVIDGAFDGHQFQFDLPAEAELIIDDGYVR
ncbi:MAG: hypothetical protein RL336_765 [Pseudomonadota bacterium]